MKKTYRLWGWAIGIKKSHKFKISERCGQFIKYFILRLKFLVSENI